MESTIAVIMNILVICILTIPSGNYQGGYHDLPEHFVIGVTSNHIQVNQGLLYNSFCGMCAPNTGKTIQNQPTSKSSLVLKLGYLLLLTCGDVHPCPGPKTPNYKYPCGICFKPVKCNQKGILCDMCNLWHHIKCINMPVTEYFRLAENEEEPWECPNCQFPYRFSDSFFNASVDDISVNVSVNSSSSESVQDKDIFTEFYQLKRKYPRKFIVSHININSFQYKHGELSILLLNKLVDCLFISESKLNDSHLNSAFNIDGYTLYRSDNTILGMVAVAFCVTCAQIFPPIV